jgi:hypothetical protein
MPTFDNLKGLKKYIDESLKSVVKENVKNEIITTIKEHIDSDVYDVYPNPEEYERKHYLENSLVGKTFETSNGVGLIVEHDESKMNYYSVVSGDKVSGNAVASWIEHGQIHPLWGDDYAYLDERPYMSNSKEELIQENVIPHVMKKHLKKLGIDSTVL